jgi:glycosyltransferase involved in cell wall biosynthesis
MTILLLNQFFWPDCSATSQILTDLAHHIAAEGHSVIAVCSDSSTQNGDQGPSPPVDIVRVRCFGFSRRPLARVASYVSFLLGALTQSFFAETDIVVTLTTPPLLAVVGTILKKTRRVKHYIWEMDVYPDIVSGLGLMNRRSLPIRLAGYIADWTRRNADGIIALGEDMKLRLVAHGIAPGKIHVAENWADSFAITPSPFPEGPLTIHYSGNLGLAHDIDTIARAMEALRSDSQFRFVFAGGGERRAGLQAFCRERDIKNVAFRPYCARAELGLSLAEGHIGLVTQKSEAIGTVVPSKTYGIMAAGRPLLYIGPSGTEPARIIEKFECGWRIEPGDVAGLVNLLRALAVHPSRVHEAGLRARSALVAHYDRHIGVARIASILGVESPSASRAASGA